MSKRHASQPPRALGNAPVSWMVALLGAACGCGLNTEPLGPNSGPEGYLPKFTATEQPNSNVSLTASQVVEKDGNIGIGGVATSAKFNVRGYARVYNFLSDDPTSLYVATFNADALKTDSSRGSGQLSIVMADKPSNHSVGLISDGNPDSGLLFATRSQSDLAARLTITGSGNVGIGTTSPMALLHVLSGDVRFQGAGRQVIVERNSDDAAAHSLTFFKSRGSPNLPTAVQRADLLGTLNWWGHDGAGPVTGAMIDAYVETTPGPGDMPTYLRFATTGDGSASPNERMRISSSGNVGIGTTVPGTTLDVNGIITHKGTMMASSKALKQNIRDLTAADAVTALSQLRPTRYAYRSQPDEERLGFIAEDVPALVSYRNRKGLDPMEFAALLTKVVQQQQKAIQEQQRRIYRLELSLAALKETGARHAPTYSRQRVR